SRGGGRQHQHAGLDPRLRVGTGGLVRSAQPASAQEHRQRVESPTPGGPAALDMLADPGYRLAQASFDAAERDAQALGYLTVREVAEIGELDQLLLPRRQRADGVADRLAHQGTRKALPCVLAFDLGAHALDEHSLQAFVSATNSAPVDGPVPEAGHEPGAPGAAGGGRNRVVLGWRRGNQHGFPPLYMKLRGAPNHPKRS